MTSYYAFKRFEEQAARLGLAIRSSKYSGEEVALFPTAEHWPCYNTDFQMWSGSIEGMVAFMSGLEKGLEYSAYLGWNRDKAEEKYRKEAAARLDRYEKKKVMTKLKDHTVEVPDYEPDVLGAN
jgi:hypothetical protein